MGGQQTRTPSVPQPTESDNDCVDTGSFLLPEQRTALHLLWLKRTLRMYRRLSNNIIREILLYESDIILPLYRYPLLTIYNPSTDEIIATPKYLDLPPNPFFCVLNNSEVLVVSMSQNTDTAWVNLVSWECRPFPGFPQGKYGPAAIVATGYVYTFGGHGLDGCDSSCEKARPTSRNWASLPCLSRPQSPTACRYHWEVYLPDSSYFEYMDVFDLRSESFRVIPLKMKVAWTPISLITEGILTLLGDGKHICQWVISDTSKEFITYTEKHAIAGPSSCQPLWRLQKWLWINHVSGKLHIYSPGTRKVASKDLVWK